MNWFIHNRLGHFLQNVAGEGGEQSGGAATQATQTQQTSTVLGTGVNNDWMPEKYRTNKEDGSLDLEASSRKVADAYRNLETRLGSGDAPPKSHEEYAPKIEAEGFDWEEFKKDEGTQSFLKGAHAKGLSNSQVEYVIGEYLKAAPGLIGGAAQLTQQDCTAALQAVWTDPQAMTSNVQASYRAAHTFASEAGKPGNFESLMSKYGNDPDFIAFTANIGKELSEDTQIAGGAVNEVDFNVKTAELREQLAKMPIHDPKRAGIQQQLDQMYDARYNPKKSRLG
ncbi:hypothetical protein [Pseudomonas vranovensis]|uniref:hypothetical protein n=1 Tax=Pseudomonas vranovensis TaxID=321661 RepID=UPI003D986175